MFKQWKVRAFWDGRLLLCYLLKKKKKKIATLLKLCILLCMFYHVIGIETIPREMRILTLHKWLFIEQATQLNSAAWKAFHQKQYQIVEDFIKCLVCMIMDLQLYQEILFNAFQNITARTKLERRSRLLAGVFW